MRVAVLACSASVMMSCATPYQDMRSGYGGGGYQEKELQSGRYLVEVQVNQFTSSGKALEYLHLRAGELCPEGYELENGVASSGQGGKEIAAVVVCDAGSTAGAAPAGAAAAAPPSDPFYCSRAAAKPEYGVCARTRERCHDRQKALLEAGLDAEPCIEAKAATCFAALRVDTGARVESCFPTVGSCMKQREIAAGKHEAYSGVTECHDVDS